MLCRSWSLPLPPCRSFGRARTSAPLPLSGVYETFDQSRRRRDKTMSEALRRKLTNAGRVLAMQDQGDFVAGHVTVRLEDDKSRFLMKPATIGLEEMTPANIITVDLDGQRVGGAMPRHNEVYIHSEVLRARSDLNAVIHTHAPHAVAFSSLGKDLLPVNN